MSRSYYAIVYAYGRNGRSSTSGNRSDQIYKFDSVAERIRWLDEQARSGIDSDPIDSRHSDVRKAIRYATQIGSWPVAV